MVNTINVILADSSLPEAQWMAPAITVVLIVLIAAVFYSIINFLILPAATKIAVKTRTDWDEICIRHGVLRYLAWLMTAVLIHSLARTWLASAINIQGVIMTVANLATLVSTVFLIHAFLDAVQTIYRRFTISRQVPIRVFIQVAKLTVLLVALVMSLAVIMNRSPVFLVSGLGAMTAVLMLIFKDPILGFVAGIQLTANRMLAVGDWLEMPKYNADGDVIDITLTTVKVSNWDRTITTIPTYALISDAFKNWRGMIECGGRRIMRSLFIDTSSIHFLSQDDIERLRHTQLITDYIAKKLDDIEQDNQQKGIDLNCPANGRHLTNIGTFRAYLVEYLKQHPRIRQDMLMIVRQLQPTPQGLPLEIYAFAATTQWAEYEGIQSDIFDHIMAVVPEFGLRVFQSPSGADILSLNAALH